MKQKQFRTGILIALTLACSFAQAQEQTTPQGQIQPTPASNDLKGTIELSGHTSYRWYLAPSFVNSPGTVILWVDGFPITGRYNDVGPYRIVQLDQYGAGFIYYVYLDAKNCPVAVIVYFWDDFGNWISPGKNVLTDAL